MPYQRPATVPIGQIWGAFGGNEADTPRLFFSVRDIENAEKKEIAQHGVDNFLKDEPLCQVLGITNDSVAVSAITKNWMGFLSEDVSMLCQNEEDRDFVGACINQVLTIKNEVQEMVQPKSPSKSLNNLYTVLAHLEDAFDVFKHYNVEAYFAIHVMFVLSKYRGHGVGKNMIIASERLAKSLGIKVAVVMTTALSSQKVVEKMDYELLKEIPYEELLKHGVDLKQCTTPTAKLFGKRLLN